MQRIQVDRHCPRLSTNGQDTFNKTRKVPFTEDLCQEREEKTLQIGYLGGFGGLILKSGSVQISCACLFCAGPHFSQFKEDGNNPWVTKILGQQNFCCEGLTLGRGAMDCSGCFQGKRNNPCLICSVLYCSSCADSGEEVPTDLFHQKE